MALQLRSRIKFPGFASQFAAHFFFIEWISLEAATGALYNSRLPNINSVFHPY